MKTMKKAQGFSLIEVLAAVSVSAIVAISVVPKLISFKDNAETSKLKEIHATIISTAETYKALAEAGMLGPKSVDETYTLNTQEYKFHTSGYPDIVASKQKGKLYLHDLIHISGDVKSSRTNQKWSISLGNKCIAYQLNTSKKQLELMSKDDTDGILTTNDITDGIRSDVNPDDLTGGTCRNNAVLVQNNSGK